MDGGNKKKLNLNPRTNASPLSLITFAYDTALYNCISSVVYVCMSANLLHLYLFAQYTTLYELIDDFYTQYNFVNNAIQREGYRTRSVGQEDSASSRGVKKNFTKF
jgi:hypothetical protein